jgi:ubiquinone/menaquinone biosynthesis C-methylase UbiE
MMARTLVQQQFGATAQHYLTSKPHAQGRSLERLVELAAPQPHWQALDVATGAGHVAYAFAPRVAQVIATDITPEMLAVVRGERGRRGLANLDITFARAEALPFASGSFDLVTCRIAPHHFDSIPAFLAEVARVLRRGGTFALVDNVVPEGRVGDYLNALDRLRDPSHLRAWTLPEWRAALADCGFALAHEEELVKQMEFTPWVSRHDATTQRLLRALITEVTPAVAAVLSPEGGDEDLRFHLREGLFIAKRG